MELHKLTLTDAAGKIQSREISSVDFATALCEQATRHADLNVFIHFDSDRLIRDARRADEKQASGQSLGHLHGIPIAIKDCIDVAGLPTT
ncbi:amidase family protein, partial [Ruegeria sp. NA]